MEFRFPLDDVKIDITEKRRDIQSPLFSDSYHSINQDEFSMVVEKAARFYASGGRNISILPYPDADKSIIELYLNGSVFGAILHQRKIIPLHGSCFNFKGLGIMVCGDAGVGKSSVTASFCLDGAEFLTDDITPLLFFEGKTYIWAVSDCIKLRIDTLQQLNQKEEGLKKINPAVEKFFLPMHSDKGTIFPLDRVFIVELHDRAEIIFEELSGSSIFTALWNEIYRKLYLQGMPENEPVYFNKLISMSKTISITRVLRPAGITISQFHKELVKKLSY